MICSHGKNYASYLFVVILLVLTISLYTGCGGSGDDGADDDGQMAIDYPDVPDDVRYSVSKQIYSNLDLFRSIYDGTTFQLTDVNLEGTYNRETADTTLNENMGIIFTVSPYGEIDELKISVEVPDGNTVRWVGKHNPSEGNLQINIISPEGEFESDRISVTVNNLPGVTIIGSAGPNPVVGSEANLKWQEFEDVANDDTAPTYQKIARLGYSAWRIVFEHVVVDYDFLKLIIENDDDLEAYGSIEITGDTFQNVPGTMLIAWVDESGDAEVGPGDSFNATFTSWWNDDPDDDIDDFYDGILKMLEYTRTEYSVGGDLSFSDFREQETENNLILPDASIVNGGFNITYSW